MAGQTASDTIDQRDLRASLHSGRRWLGIRRTSDVRLTVVINIQRDHDWRDVTRAPDAFPVGRRRSVGRLVFAKPVRVRSVD